MENFTNTFHNFLSNNKVIVTQANQTHNSDNKNCFICAPKSSLCYMFRFRFNVWHNKSYFISLWLFVKKSIMYECSYT